MRRSAIAVAACLLIVTGCAEDRHPTDVEVERPISVAPGPPAPPPPPPPPPAPAPGGDNRRSFVWTKESGFTILENPKGVILVSANGINDSGEVVGTVIMHPSAGAPVYRGFRWTAATGFTFIVGPAAVNTFVRGIDDQGQVAGYIEFGNQRQVYVWNKTDTASAIGVSLPYLHVLGIRDGVIFGNALGRGATMAYRFGLASGQLEILETANESGGGILAVNAAREAAGYDGDINHGFGGTSDAVVWDGAGNRTVAFDCKGEWNCFAYLSAINSSGIAAGVVTQGELEESRMFRWSRSKGLEFLNLPRPAYATLVTAITDDGSIVAQNGREAFIFSASGTLTEIRPPATHGIVQPRAVNDRGHVVGMLF